MLYSNYNCSYGNMINFLSTASPSTPQIDAQEPNQRLHCRSPSEVCKTCFDKYNRSVWLASLLCTQPEEHRSFERVTVMVDASKIRVVRVCEPPANPASHSSAATCCSQCKRVHSPEELHYWKLQTIHRELERLPKVGGNNILCGMAFT